MIYDTKRGCNIVIGIYIWNFKIFAAYGIVRLRDSILISTSQLYQNIFMHRNDAPKRNLKIAEIQHSEWLLEEDFYHMSHKNVITI